MGHSNWLYRDASRNDISLEDYNSLFPGANGQVLWQTRCCGYDRADCSVSCCGEESNDLECVPHPDNAARLAAGLSALPDDCSQRIYRCSKCCSGRVPSGWSEGACSTSMCHQFEGNVTRMVSRHPVCHYGRDYYHRCYAPEDNPSIAETFTQSDTFLDYRRVLAAYMQDSDARTVIDAAYSGGGALYAGVQALAACQITNIINEGARTEPNDWLHANANAFLNAVENEHGFQPGHYRYDPLLAAKPRIYLQGFGTGAYGFEVNVDLDQFANVGSDVYTNGGGGSGSNGVDSGISAGDACSADSGGSNSGVNPGPTTRDPGSGSGSDSESPPTTTTTTAAPAPADINIEVVLPTNLDPAMVTSASRDDLAKIERAVVNSVATQTGVPAEHITATVGVVGGESVTQGRTSGRSSDGSTQQVVTTVVINAPAEEVEAINSN